MKIEGISQHSMGHSVPKTLKSQKNPVQNPAKTVGVWKELDRHSLLCQAMWELIKEKTALTDKMLLDKIHQMGLTEPYQNGKIKEYPVKCSQCNRHTNHDKNYCIYCGAGVARPKKGLFLDITSTN